MQMPRLLHKLLRTRRNKDIFLFILFFLLAALLWFGHAMQSVRTTTVPVYIHYTGKPGHIGLTKEGLPSQVMITVRDAGHRLRAYHKNPPHITIDLHQYIHGDSGTILIPSNDLRASIKAVLQDNSNLLSTSTDEIQCGYFKEAGKPVTVIFTGKANPADGYQQIGEPQLTHQRIQIYGPKDIINKIDTIRTKAAVFNNLTNPLNARVALEVPKGIRAEMDSVTVTLPVEQFIEKRLSVKIEVANPKDIQEGVKEVLFFPSTVDVNIRVGSQYADKINESYFKATCKYPLSVDVGDRLEVTLNYQENPHITSMWFYPKEVEYRRVSKDIEGKKAEGKETTNETGGEE